MFDYIVRLLVWAVEGGGAEVLLHPVYEFFWVNVEKALQWQL